VKICVIGNSHVAVIKAAYDLLPTENMPELTFFADRGSGIEELVVQDGKLCAEAGNARLTSALRFTSGGLAQIDPEAYDRFLIIGLVQGVKRLVQMVEDPFSQAVRNHALAGFWRERAITKMCEKLREITDKPVSFGLTPLPAAPKVNEIGPETYEQMVKLSYGLHFSKMGVDVVGQPSETIANRENTEQVFSIGSARLRVKGAQGVQEHSDEDIYHMNTAYGSLWLENYLGLTQIT